MFCLKQAGALVFALPCLAIAQIASLQIKILEGDQAVHTPNSHRSAPLTVEVLDDFDQPVAGAAVSFRLPEEGAGGVFGNGLRTELVITDANGRASARHIRINDVPGQFEIRIVAAKDQSRAGAVSTQFINDPRPQPSRVVTTSKPKPHGNRKWAILTLVAAGAAGGVATGVVKSGNRTQGASAAPAPSLTIGAPSIVIGKP